MNKRILFGSCVTLLISGLLLTIMYLSKSSTQEKATTNNTNKFQKLSFTSPLVVSGKVQSTEVDKYSVPEASDDTIVQVLVKQSQQIHKGQILYSVTSNDKKQTVTEENYTLSSLYRKLDLASATLKVKQSEKVTTAIEKNQRGIDIKTQQYEIQDISDQIAELQGKIKADTAQVTQNIVSPTEATVVYNDNSITLYGSNAEVKGNISEYDYYLIKEGMKATVYSLIDDKAESCKVATLSRLPVATAKQSTQYSISLPITKKFISGQSVKISIPQHYVIIPLEDTKKINGNYFVKLKSGKGKLQLTKVTGIIHGDTLYANSGVSAGNLVSKKFND